MIIIPSMLLHAEMQLFEEFLASLGLLRYLLLCHILEFGVPEEKVRELLFQVHI